MAPRYRRLVKITGWALAIYGLTTFLVLHTPVADWLVRPLVVWPAHSRANAIVVLTTWATPNRILNEPGVWRTLEATRLYREGLAPVIVVSGSGSASPAMVDMLSELGVPSNAIELEGRSQDTHDSAVNIAELARTRHWSQILLVTDAKHMRRAQGAFVRQGLSVSPAPSMMWEMWWDQPYDRYRKLHGAIHEYMGLVYYWWRGWV